MWICEPAEQLNLTGKHLEEQITGKKLQKVNPTKKQVLNKYYKDMKLSKSMALNHFWTLQEQKAIQGKHECFV